MHKFLKIARKVAMKSICRYRLGAVLVKGGAIINFGYNRTGHHNLIEKKKTRDIDQLHAEVDAVLGIAKIETRKCDIWIARIKNDDQLGLAKPCEMCQLILKEMGIRRVFYSIENEPFYDIIKL